MAYKIFNLNTWYILNIALFCIVLVFNRSWIREKIVKTLFTNIYNIYSKNIQITYFFKK